LSSDPHTASVLLPGGKPPAAGDVFKNPALATSLEQIAKGGRDAFYKGPIGKAIADEVQKRGGLIAAQDIAAYHADWVDPISTTYRGYKVLELPPNTQGIVSLEMLNILEGFDLKPLGHNSAAYLHLLVEAKRIAFADRDAWIGDPSATPPDAIAKMLSKEYAAARRKEISPDHVREHAPLTLDGQKTTGPEEHPQAKGDTVYLTAVDGEGNAVSLIQSLFEIFGSGIVAGDTGVVLQNRGSLFSLTPGHPNQVAPGKRPFHTLVPAMVLKDDRPWFSFGV